MSPLLKKEIRLLLPAWCVALLLAAVTPWFHEYPFSVSGTAWIAAIGAINLAVTVFGREFALGTFSSLLAQPVARHRLMTVKAFLLGIAMASVLAAFWLSYVAKLEVIVSSEGWEYWRPALERYALRDLLMHQRWEVLVMGGAVTASIFAGGLWTTLVFRQMVSAFWVTVLVPGLLIVLSTWLGIRVGDEVVGGLVCVAMLALYSLVGLALSWRLFQRAEDAPFSWGAKTLPSISGLVGMKHDRPERGPGHPVIALIRQEFLIHQAGLMGAAVLLLLNLGCMGVRASGLVAEGSDIDKILEPIGSFWLLIPLLVGASAVSEERRLGTLEAHLCLPVSRRRQFLIKFGVAAALGVLLGAGALLVTEALGTLMGVTGLWDRKDPGEAAAFGLAAACLALTSIGIYASSLSRSTLQALGTAVVIALIGMFTINVMSVYNLRHFLPTSWIPGVCWAALLVGMIGLAYRNFGHLHCGLRRVMQNVWIIFLTLAVVATLCAALYFRAWELVMPAEPDHGPAQIAGSGHPRIAGMAVESKLLILLPDGRLWVSGPNARLRVGDWAIMFPLSGRFLATSNWTDVAGCVDQAIALRSDGTVWSLFRAEITNRQWKLVEDQPHQLGVETNWVAIAAGQAHLLALKGDGTLWGWGGNKESQLAAGPERLTNGLIRIGLDSDWTAIFARDHSSVGVKRDGTTWQWGRCYTARKDGLGFENETYTQPTPWAVDLSGVRKIRGGYPSDLLLLDDETLWAVGQLPNGILGPPTRSQYAQEPVRVGGGRLWADIGTTWNEVAGVSGDGRLWKSTWWERQSDPDRLSKYSDWLAVEGVFGQCLVALAADGTLSCWAGDYGRGPLAPSRRPLVSYNIFDEAE